MRTLDLTPRRRQILRLLCRGLNNEEIARELGLKLATVKFHLKWIDLNIGAREGLSARVHAVVLAHSSGFAYEDDAGWDRLMTALEGLIDQKRAAQLLRLIHDSLRDTVSAPEQVALATRLESACSTAGEPSEEAPCAPSSPSKGVASYGQLTAPLGRSLALISTSAGIKVRTLGRPRKSVLRGAVLVIDERLRLVKASARPKPVCSGCAKEALARAVAKHHHGLWQFAHGFRSSLSIQSGTRRIIVRRSAAAGSFAVNCDGTDTDGWSRRDATALVSMFVATDLVHALRGAVPWKESCGICKPILTVVDEPAS